MSGRAVVVGFVLVTLALAYAYPVRAYLAQRAEINRLNAAQNVQWQRIEELTEQLSKWEDDEYVIRQIRRRLHYVRPGETAYIIVDSPGSGSGGSGQSSNVGPWFSQLWSNLQAADNPRTR